MHNLGFCKSASEKEAQGTTKAPLETSQAGTFQHRQDLLLVDLAMTVAMRGLEISTALSAGS